MPAIPDVNDRRPVFVQIADDLREQIKSGRLPVDSRLPSQTTLAEQYGVAPNTLRTALRVLASEGLISTQSTRGTFVLKVPEESEPSPNYNHVMETVRQLADRVEALETQVGELRGQRRKR